MNELLNLIEHSLHVKGKTVVVTNEAVLRANHPDDFAQALTQLQA